MRRLRKRGFSSLPDRKGDGFLGVAAEVAVEHGLTPKQVLDCYYGDADPDMAHRCKEVLGPSWKARSLFWSAGYYSRDGKRPQAVFPAISEAGARFLDELHRLVMEKQARLPGERLGPRSPGARVVADDPSGRTPPSAATRRTYRYSRVTIASLSISHFSDS